MSAIANYLLHLADNAVVLGQRNAEWCGHGPAIEEDIALANMSLDLVGQAPMSLQQRLVDLPAAAAAATAEDLVAFAGTCWLLVGEPGPDKLGLIRRWIALPFEPAPAFDDVGAPLLTWNGVAWVPSA